MTNEEIKTRQHGVNFMNQVKAKVDLKYRSFESASQLQNLGCIDDIELRKNYERFKTSVDNCTVINSDLIYFN